MTIQIRTAVRSGRTEFDAYRHAFTSLGVDGVASSGAAPLEFDGHRVVEEGDALVDEVDESCRRVFAIARVSSTPGEQAWTGLGWVFHAEDRGFLVRHGGTSEAAVRADIRLSLSLAVRALRLRRSAPISMRVAGGMSTHLPICALAVAVFDGPPFPIEVDLNGDA